ncbi:MAG: lyase family protein [Reinekea sp.]
MTDLQNTGRLKSLLDEDLRAEVFGHISDATVVNELRYYALIDFAHVSMLQQQGIVESQPGTALKAEIGRLFSTDFQDLINLPTQRGTYLCYENYLINLLGVATGGLLQTGRSRNDLNATVFKMRLRERMAKTLMLLQTLLQTIQARASSETSTLFPAFTHYQTAFTSTLGHYLSGIATHLFRDADKLLSALPLLDNCPLGACAGGGTTIPIDRHLTANLLGFSGPVRHSIDAVASRDSCLHILSAMASISTTLSRCASDIVFMSSNETALLLLPDSLVGSSSNMPQKRNPFLLEIVKGRSANIVSAWTSTATAMQWNAFSNSVAISSEATRPIWSALDDLDFTLRLMSKIIEGIEVNQQQALRTMESGMIDAVYIAEQLAYRDHVPFRDAHHTVGEQVNSAIADNVALRSKFSSADQSPEQWFGNIATATAYGGGCGDPVDLEPTYQQFSSQHRLWLENWQPAINDLTDAVRQSASGTHI